MKQKNSPRFIPVGVLLLFGVALCPAQQSLSWEQVKSRFESANPALKADALNVDETQAQEITAYLRPNRSSQLRRMALNLFPATASGNLWQVRISLVRSVTSMSATTSASFGLRVPRGHADRQVPT